MSAEKEKIKCENCKEKKAIVSFRGGAYCIDCFKEIKKLERLEKINLVEIVE